MSASIRDRYQRMLDLYPRSWRREHGPAMLGTLLDAAEHEGRDQPTAAERRDLMLHAGLARISIVMPERVRQGVASVALATGAAFAVTYLIFAAWAPFMQNREEVHAAINFGPFMNSGVVLCVAWIVAFGCALLGWRSAAQGVLVGTLVIAGLTLVANYTVTEWAGPASRNVGFLVMLAALALVGAPARRGRLALGAAAALAIFLACLAVNRLLGGYVDTAFWTIVAQPINMTLALFLGLVLAVFLMSRRQLSEAAAVLWSAAPWLAVAWLYIALDDPNMGMVLPMLGLLVVGFLVAAAYALRRAGVRVSLVREGELAPAPSSDTSD